MTEINIITKNPVPSCNLKEFIWSEGINSVSDGEWRFRYEARIPDDVEVDEDGNFDKVLYVYGHIQQLYLVESVTNNSINIEINSKQELVDIVNEQYKEDMKFRRRWINENPDYYDNVHTTTIENKTQYSNYDHVIFIKEQGNNETEFVVAPKKGVE